MKISTNISPMDHLMTEEQAVFETAAAGFDAFDFSMFDMANPDSGCRLAGDGYLTLSRELRRIAKENGIICNQSHAPFPVCKPQVRDMLKRAIECTAEAGGNICVIHPDNNKSAEENAVMYAELLPFAESYGVRMATENMFNWDSTADRALPAACSSPKDFLRHIEAVNSPFLVACVDIGHAEMEGVNTSAAEMIRTLGHHVQALHIHDNDKIHDRHQIPFSMQIDYAPIVRALKEIGYTGYFTLEADTYMKAFTPDTAKDGIRDMARAARKLADMFENA